ncbi:MAG TPA: tetratricopeptide repeat protein [Chitinophagaceae bacterium]|nr:tetratricopeptide repeat protein [Chitinophagaceae bacterium]
MRIQKATFLFFIFIFSTSRSFAQQAAALDSMKSSFAKAKTAEEKVFWLDMLSRTAMNVNPGQAEEYGKQLITFAEETRDRKLMVKAYMSNGIRCGYFTGQKDYAARSVEYYNKALQIARQNKMEEETGAIQLKLCAIHLAIPDKDRALNYINQAFSLISTLKNDSLKAEAHNTYGLVYQARNEKTLSLRHFLNGLQVAEATKIPELRRNCYLHLSNFYSRIEDYDKAIDYYMKANKELDHVRGGNVGYQRAIDFNSIGNLFASKRNNDIALSYFEKSIALADSLKFPTLKIPGYLSVLNQHLRIDHPQKALEYMNSSSGLNLKKYLSNMGMSGQIDQVYAVIYTKLKDFDSAGLYFNKALPYFEQKTSEPNRINFYVQLGDYYQKTDKNDKAIEYFQKVKEMGERNGQLENTQAALGHLDSLYVKKGDFRLANQYNVLYYQYKDSIDKLKKENELTQIEAFDEQQRHQRALAEEQELKEKRNRIQYMGIIIGIAILFVALVMMGWFKVSATTIRAIGFFSFLIFFEFIFLVFKKNIYGITQGEPLYDLAFMIGLAAILVPLHHWLEHRVIHFLTSHHMLKLRGIFSRRGQDNS